MNSRAASPVIALRHAGAADLALIDQIMRESFDPRFGEAWTQPQVHGILALPGVWLRLAMIGDEPAGFALSRATLDEAELLLLATRPRWRRMGVAGALMRLVIADARSRKVERLHLEVRANNPAIAFYARHGFEKVGERPHYYRGAQGHHHDAHSYSLIID